jgi:hypothetical protein
MEPREYALCTLLLAVVLIRRLLKPKVNLIVSGILFVATLTLFIISSKNKLQLIGFSALLVGYLVFFYYRYKRLILLK